jgi:hypothetical protein
MSCIRRLIAEPVLNSANSESLTLAPAELAAQRVKESAFAETNQLDAITGPLAANLVTQAQFIAGLTIHGEQALGGNTLNSHRETRVTANHDRPERKQMRADGSDDEGVDVGREDGAIRRQGVGC